ncbi:MAG: RNA 3'-terminal phosphate cyclase [Candidatus Thermoplasmatota archaeon]|nr:RNA 3'-terminal phosphate cyclase [Candidatus Thermoplasmatota archaeon]
MIEVDGSHGEGGGQIYRMALALAALKGEEVRITNIRAGRPKPGLARQHMTAAKAVASMTDGRVKGLRLGSPEVIFRPGPLKGGSISLDVGTAGSVTLVLQACLLPAILAGAPTVFRIRGGTDVKWSPPADYFIHVFLPQLKRMSIHAEMSILKRGYYPRGGGLVEMRVEPCPSIRALRLPNLGEIRSIGGKAHVSNLPEHIAQRMRRSAMRQLVDYRNVDIHQELYGESEAVRAGGAIALWAEFDNTTIGSSALAEKGVKAEDLGRGAAEELLADLKAGATLDVHAADQLLPYMAMAQDASSFTVREVSGHTRTLFWLLSKFLAVDIQEEKADRIDRIEVRPGATLKV